MDFFKQAHHNLCIQVCVTTQNSHVKIFSIYCKNVIIPPNIYYSRTKYKSLFLHIDHWGKLSYLSVLFSGTLHSNGYIFPFLLCFSLCFFTQLFVGPPQTAILLFCIFFPWGWSWSLSPVEYYEPPSIVHQTLCLSDLVQFALIHGPNIPGSYAILLSIASDLASITSHIHNWILFLLTV